MTPESRRQWLMEWISNHTHADVLDAEFVDQYIIATKASFRPSNWGAHKCPSLSMDLSSLARAGQLTRWRCGLKGSWQPGFPRWVWTYEIPKTTKHSGEKP